MRETCLLLMSAACLLHLAARSGEKVPAVVPPHRAQKTSLWVLFPKQPSQWVWWMSDPPTLMSSAFTSSPILLHQEVDEVNEVRGGKVDEDEVAVHVEGKSA